jgi:hypothetical protein
MSNFILSHPHKQSRELASKVLKLICAEHNATEEKPLKLGNVEFWLNFNSAFDFKNPEEKSLCWSIPTNNWNEKEVQTDINKYAAPLMDKIEKLV